jgi:multidrug efflux pump
VVSVSTTYRGASAEVIEERITQVIERQVAGIQGIDRVNSSRDGRSQITITFNLDRDLDAAANDVRDAVSRVTANLPDQADPPQIAKANADASPIIILNLTSTTLDPLQLADYADRYLVERMSTIDGVAQANLFGAKIYAMRIWLDANQMAARGVSVDDVENALNSQNLELPAGSLESASKDFTIRVARSYAKPEDFARLPLRPADASGFVLRLGDVARIEEGADERRKPVPRQRRRPGRHRPDPSVPGQRRRHLRGRPQGSRHDQRRACRPAPRWSWPWTTRCSPPRPSTRSGSPWACRSAWSCWSTWCSWAAGARR